MQNFLISIIFFIAYGSDAPVSHAVHFNYDLPSKPYQEKYWKWNLNFVALVEKLNVP